MASRSRRSNLEKGDKNEDASINSPNGPKTRINHAVPNTNQSSYSSIIDDIFESDDIYTPSKQKVNVSQKKLKDDEIRESIESDDDIYSLTYKNNKTDEFQNHYTSTKERPKGIKENDVKKQSKSSGTPRKTRSTVVKINYNEDELMNKHEQDCLNNINSATPRSIRKNNKSKATNEVLEISPRKRSKQNTPEKEFEGHVADENEMDQAKYILSPPKWPKSRNENEETPKKNSGSVESVKSTKNAAKRKINYSPKSKNLVTSPRITRHSKRGMNCEESSISDDNIPNVVKEPKVILQPLNKTTTKKTNQQNSKANETHESEESEIENKMCNANKKERYVVLPRSPSKDMQNLNINADAEFPKSSIVLRLRKWTPSCTSKSSTEKAEDTRRKSQRITKQSRDTSVYFEKGSDDESADSSDNYEGEEEISDSEEQGSHSGNDSAEESQTPRKRMNILKTPRKNTATSKARKKSSKISMDTPTKAISRMSIGTPTLDKHRRTNSISKPITPLQKARATLHVSVLPKSLPCREEQFNDIYSFLHARLSDGSGGCIYISGVPGTGKTATVSEVIRCLKKSMNKGELAEFDYIDINGMKLSEPRQAYVQMWKQMTGETKTWEESHKLLQNKFTNSNSKRHMTLLLVDEMDLLCTKRQDVVYNLLDWPNKNNAKLVVVTIANTMDLPERILMGRVTSRLGLTRLTFPPYNFKQLEEIVVSRLKGANAFGGETIQLVARKVAAVSGDARRALDICRRSAEIAEKNGRQLVSMIDVKQALDEMIASPKIQAIKHCSDMEKYFLQGVCTEVQRTGIEEVVFKNVYMQMETLCTLDGLKAPNVSEALEICARLGSWRLLLCDHSRMDIHQRLLLNVSTDDVYFATKNINA